RTCELVAGLTRLQGVRAAFKGPCFHEAVVVLDRPVAPLLLALANKGILGGLDLSEYYPELLPGLRLSATETKTEPELDRCVAALGERLQSARHAPHRRPARLAQDRR